MAKKWSEIDSISTATDTHEFVVIKDGFSKRISKQNFLQELVAKNTSQDSTVSGLSSSVSTNTNSINILTPKVAQNESDILQLKEPLRVINNSGATILKGKACRHNGVVAGQVQIVLALADTLVNAVILGVASSDILDGEIGALTTFGIIENLDTLAVPTGVPLYLSATVAGGFTEIAPDVATRIGGALIQNATTGKLFVSMENTIALPTVFGSLAGGSAGLTFIANTYQLLGSFASEEDVLMPTNALLGSIKAPSSGKYRLSSNIAIIFDAVGNNLESIELAIFDDVAGFVKGITSRIAKNGESASFYPSFIFDAVKDRTYHIELKCSFALQNVIYDLATFDISSVHIR